MSLKEIRARNAAVKDAHSRQTIRNEEIEKIQKTRGIPQGGFYLSGNAGHGVIDIAKSIKDVPENRREVMQMRHDVNDAAYLLLMMNGKNDMGRSMREFIRKSAKMADLRKADPAMDTTDTANWVPTGMSGTLIDMVRYNLLVADLFPEITMPTNPYDPPVLTGSATGYLVSESTDMDGVAPTGSTVTDGKATLTAQKIAAMITVSEELTEDSIIPVLPLIRTEIARTLAEELENAIVNGDTTAIHANADVDPGETWASASGISDSRYAFDGLRKKLIENSLRTDASANTVEVYSKMIADCAQYGANVDRLVWIASSLSKHMLRVILSTKDQYTTNQVVVKGEIGKLIGAPVVVTGKLRQDMNTAGIYDPSSPKDNKSALILVNRDSFMLGSRRIITIKSDTDIKTDQQIIVANMREAFRAVYADGQTYGRYGYNVG